MTHVVTKKLLAREPLRNAGFFIKLTAGSIPV